MTVAARYVVGSMAFAMACSAAADADRPAFYVLDVDDASHATLYASSATLPKFDLPFVQLGKPGMDCCFRFGRKPGAGKASVRGADVVRELMTENGDETFKYPGYVALRARTKPAGGETALAFGIEGMTAATAMGDVYVVTLANQAKPVILRYCYSSEGLKLSLFRSATDKKPYTSYYYYLGYDLESNCR